MRSFRPIKLVIHNAAVIVTQQLNATGLVLDNFLQFFSFSLRHLYFPLEHKQRILHLLLLLNLPLIQRPPELVLLLHLIHLIFDPRIILFTFRQERIGLLDLTLRHFVCIYEVFEFLFESATLNAEFVAETE